MLPRAGTGPLSRPRQANLAKVPRVSARWGADCGRVQVVVAVACVLAAHDCEASFDVCELLGARVRTVCHQQARLLAKLLGDVLDSLQDAGRRGRLQDKGALGQRRGDRLGREASTGRRWDHGLCRVQKELLEGDLVGAQP